MGANSKRGAYLKLGTNLRIYSILLFYKYSIFHAGFSEVETKSIILSEVNRKVKTKGPSADNTRDKAANLRPQKPIQKKGK